MALSVQMCVAGANKTLQRAHFGVVVVELINNCKYGGIVRNEIW